MDTTFRAYVEGALKLLAASKSAEARRALTAIRRRHVRVEPLDHLTAADFRRVRRDLLRWNIPLRESDFARLHDTRSQGFRAIARTLNGYMWGDRVYVHRDLKPRQLAATLVHEVSHVLNESAAHYRTPKAVLLEEYRAYFAEKRFAGVEMTPARCRALKWRVIREYQLAGVTPDDVPDLPPSRARRARR